MTFHLPEQATPEGTFPIQVSFADQSGTAITPNALTWTLTDEDGTVINSRDGVSITAASTVTIVLSGDDLVATDSQWRYLLVEGNYDSSYGNGLPIVEEVKFELEDLLNK